MTNFEDWKEVNSDEDFDFHFCPRQRQTHCTGIMPSHTPRIILFEPQFKGRWYRDGCEPDEKSELDLTAPANSEIDSDSDTESVEIAKTGGWGAVKTAPVASLASILEEEKAENERVIRRAKEDVKAALRPPRFPVAKREPQAGGVERAPKREPDDADWKEVSSSRNRGGRAPPPSDSIAQCRFGAKCNRVRYSSRSSDPPGNSPDSSLCTSIHPGETDTSYKARIGSKSSSNSRSPSVSLKAQLCSRGRQCSKSYCEYAHKISELVVPACQYRDCRYVRLERNGEYRTPSGVRPCKSLHRKETLENYARRVGTGKSPNRKA